MRRIALATLAAILALATSAGAATADSTQTGGGTFTRAQDPPKTLGTIGSLTLLRWTEVIDFEGALDGESACTVHALQSPTSLSFIGWCRYTGSVGESDPGTASGPSAGRLTFVPTFDGSIAFALRGGTGGLEGLRLTGSADPLTGTYFVTYRFAGG